MEELIISLVSNAPATAVLLYVLYLADRHLKQMVEKLEHIESLLEQSRDQARGERSGTSPKRAP